MENPNALNFNYFREKCDEEARRIEVEHPGDLDFLEKFNSFREIIPFLDSSLSHFRYNVFDFNFTAKIFTLTLNREIEPELEYDFFDSIIVSEVIPYVVINSSDKEKIKLTSTFVSKDRKYKIFYPEQEDSVVPRLIKEWNDDRENFKPGTLVLKVLTSALPNTNLSKLKTSKYATLVYKIDKDFTLKMASGPDSQKELEQAISHLEEYTSFKFKTSGLGTINGHFPVDYFVIDKSVLRWILTTKIPNPGFNTGKDYFTFSNVLWVSETDKAMAHQSQFKLRFRLGNLEQKITVSEIKESKKFSNYFDQNGIPYTFKKDIAYNIIKINKSNNPQDILLIKNILHCLFFVYAFPLKIDVNPNISFSTYYAYYLSYVAQREGFFGHKTIINTEDDSFKIGIDDIKNSTMKKIKILKIVDPTFYSRGVSDEISGKEAQPEILVRTTDKNWPNVILEFLNSEKARQFQVIRYPFMIRGENKQISNVIIPPYFIISSAKGNAKTHLAIKEAKEAYGTRGTYHPYIVYSSLRKQLSPDSEINGVLNMQQFYDDLVDLSKPFYLNKSQTSDTRPNEHRSTFTPLKEGSASEIPINLKDFFLSKMIGGDLGQNIYKFYREGTSPGPNSLIEACLISNCKKSQELREIRDKDINRVYGYNNQDFIKSYVKEEIRKMTWESASQEFYDVTLTQAKKNFMNLETEITYEYYKTVLEKYFNVSLLVITYDKRKFMIELPRYKHFHAEKIWTNRSEGIVIIRHKLSIGYSRYEPLIIENQAWNGSLLDNIFSEVNTTYRLGFYSHLDESDDDKKLVIRSSEVKLSRKVDVSLIFPPSKITHQILDNSGKLRGLLVNDLFLWCSPLHPMDVKIFESGNNRINLATNYEHVEVLESLKNIFPSNYILKRKYKTKGSFPVIKEGKVENLQKEGTFTVEGIWIEADGVKFYIAVNPTELRLNREDIDESAYFEMATSEITFKMYDYYQRLANIILQLWQAMCVYSPYDDPYFMVKRFTEINPSYEGKQIVNLSAIPRKIPTPVLRDVDAFYENGKPGRVNFENVLVLFREFYGNTLFTDDGRLIVDSVKSQRSLLHQAKMIQDLKESYFQEHGHEIEVGRISIDEEGTLIRAVNWTYAPGISSMKLEQSFIDQIPKLKILMEDRLHFKEFFVYSSDFQSKSPGQKIFMSKDEMDDFFRYENSKSELYVIEDNNQLNNHTEKNPIYYRNKKGLLYILQNVEDGDINKAIKVAKTWKEQKINLGYYSTDNIEEEIEIEAVTTGGWQGSKTLDDLNGENDSYIFIYYKDDYEGINRNGYKYAALLKVESSSSFSL